MATTPRRKSDPFYAHPNYARDWSYPWRGKKSNLRAFSWNQNYDIPLPGAAPIPSPLGGVPDTYAYPFSSYVFSVGVPITPQLATVTGPAPFNYEVARDEGGPLLPAGLAIDIVAGAISGTPTVVAGPIVVHLRAVGGGFGNRIFVTFEIVP